MAAVCDRIGLPTQDRLSFNSKFVFFFYQFYLHFCLNFFKFFPKEHNASKLSKFRKRKWLIAAVDKLRMPRSEIFNIRHSYLCTEDVNIQVGNFILYNI